MITVISTTITSFLYSENHPLRPGINTKYVVHQQVFNHLKPMYKVNWNFQGEKPDISLVCSSYISNSFYSPKPELSSNMSYSTIIKIKTKEHTVTPPSQKRDEDENNYIYSLLLSYILDKTPFLWGSGRFYLLDYELLEDRTKHLAINKQNPL